MIAHDEPAASLNNPTPAEMRGGSGHRSRTASGVALLVGGALFGVILAAVAQFLFFVGALAWVNLVVWTIIAISVGVALRTWAMTISVCAVMGFSIVFTYSMTGYPANAPLLTAIPLFAVLAIAGAFGMSAGGAIGHLLRRLGRGSPSMSRRILRTKGDESREVQE